MVGFKWINLKYFSIEKQRQKGKWMWNNRMIEEVQIFKYLGFILNNKGNYTEHIKELVRKGRMQQERYGV